VFGTELGDQDLAADFGATSVERFLAPYPARGILLLAIARDN